MAIDTSNLNFQPKSGMKVQATLHKTSSNELVTGYLLKVADLPSHIKRKSWIMVLEDNSSVQVWDDEVFPLVKVVFNICKNKKRQSNQTIMLYANRHFQIWDQIRALHSGTRLKIEEVNFEFEFKA